MSLLLSWGCPLRNSGAVAIVSLCVLIGFAQNAIAQPVITITPEVSVVEGDSGTATLSFDVTLGGIVGQPVVQVEFTTQDGIDPNPAMNATLAGGDYVFRQETLSFPGPGTQTVDVTINSDTLFELDEQMLALLSSSVNAEIRDGQGVGTISNDDPVTTFSVDTTLASDVEGDAGTPNGGIFTITQSNPPGFPIFVNFETAIDLLGADPAEPGDFIADSGAFEFGPGFPAFRSVLISYVGDQVHEADETYLFEISLDPGSPGAIAPGEETSIGTIVDDDPPQVPALGPWGLGLSALLLLTTGGIRIIGSLTRPQCLIRVAGPFTSHTNRTLYTA